MAARTGTEVASGISAVPMAVSDSATTMILWPETRSKAGADGVVSGMMARTSITTATPMMRGNPTQGGREEGGVAEFKT